MKHKPTTILVALFVIALLVVATCSVAHASFKVGNVFVGNCRGTVYVYDVTGALVQTLDATLDDGNIPCISGITFDGAGNVYVSAYDPADNVEGYSNIIKYDSSGNRIGVVIQGWNYFNSVIHDLAGNFYVGQFFGEVLKFD
jgi:hypothetical protein